MGDIIHTLPAVASVKQSFPQSYVAWAVEERWTPLLATLSSTRLSLSAGELFRMFSRRGADCAQGSSKRLSIFRDFSSLRSRLPSPGRSVSTDCIDRRHGSLLRRFSIRERLRRRRHTLSIGIGRSQPGQARQRSPARSLFPKEGPKGNCRPASLVLASPFAGWAGKQWPLDMYLDLARRLDVPLVLMFPK